MEIYLCKLRVILATSNKFILANSYLCHGKEGKLTWKNVVPDSVWNPLLEDNSLLLDNWEVGQLLGGN